MTAPVDFALCLEAIRDNAFVASPYAVVITYEDHLTPELQAKAAQVSTDLIFSICKFVVRIYFIPLEDHQTQTCPFKPCN